MKMVHLIVTSTFGLEAIVKRELQDLGFHDLLVADGKIEFEATLNDIPRLNMALRAADRVLLKIAEFPATDFGQLFDQTRALGWEEWIGRDTKITVIGKSVKSILASVRASQSIVKKAVVERLKQAFSLEWLPESGPEITIQVALLKDVAQLTLDTSGSGLHRRGYRVGHGDVPMRENLAAALVLLSPWDRETLLIDPLCGSGTILIEAALIARNMAPGINREFAAQHWPSIDAAAWDDARKALRAAARSDLKLQIRGYDIDPERIRDCRANAKKAGVEQDIVFEHKDIKDLWVSEPRGLVISNPPYGIKLGDLKSLGPLYVILHNMFKNKAGWGVCVITADKRFPDYFKRARPDKVRKLFNGTIEVNYYQYHATPDRPATPAA